MTEKENAGIKNQQQRQQQQKPKSTELPKANTCDKHRVPYASVESLYCVPETTITLYV